MKTPPPAIRFRSCLLIKHRHFWCVLLCVLTWRGPVHVIHRHEAIPIDISLVHHVENFHAGDESDGADWHLHVVSWGDLATDDSQQERSEVPVDVALVLVAPATANVGQSGLRETLRWECLSSVEAIAHRNMLPISPRLNSRGGFTTALLLDQRVCAALGISRC